MDTFLSDTSSRAHLSVAAPVVIGESSGQRCDGIFELPTMSVAARAIAGASSGQRSVDVSDSLAQHAVAPVPIGANSGERSANVPESATKTVAAPVIAGASSGQRSVDVSDSPARTWLLLFLSVRTLDKELLMSPILTSRLSQLPPVRALDKEVFLILTEARLVQFLSLPAQQK